MSLKRRLRPGTFRAGCVAGEGRTAVCSAMNPVGKPDAGNRHVRFDERGEETERCRMAQATAPLLDSTRSSGLRTIHVIASEAKQSILPLRGDMDCFVASLPCANASRLSQAMTVDIVSHSRDVIAGMSSAISAIVLPNSMAGQRPHNTGGSDAGPKMVEARPAEGID